MKLNQPSEAGEYLERAVKLAPPSWLSRPRIGPCVIAICWALTEQAASRASDSVSLENLMVRFRYCDACEQCEGEVLIVVHKECRNKLLAATAYAAASFRVVKPTLNDRGQQRFVHYQIVTIIAVNEISLRLPSSM